MKHPIILLLWVSLLGWACTPPHHQDEADHLKEHVDSILNPVPDFSGVILIANQGKPVYTKVMGYRNFETQEPLERTDIFELASVSKQFTAMIIMMLKEEGKLAYDDVLEKYVPGLPYPGITIRHLLTHTSGLPDYQAIMDEHWDKSKVAGNDDIITYLKKYAPPAVFTPGDRYEYSNTGYVLLASIAEAASGQDFMVLCRERIFTPLGMGNTDIRTLDQKLSLPSLAWGHIWTEEKQRYVRADSFPSSNYTLWLGNRKGPGRISSTAQDLLTWDQALYSDKLIPAASLREAFQPMKLNNDSLSFYGFGWVVNSDSDATIVSHTGSNPGYSTKIVRFLDDHKTLIILCNNAHREMDNLAKQLEDIVAHH